jgi:uncharacterized delta-60 repeat protein
MLLLLFSMKARPSRNVVVPAVALYLAVAGLTYLVSAAIPAGSVEFATAGFSVSEKGGTAVIIVRRDKLDGEPFTVKYATVDGAARDGEDYSATSGTLSFVPWQTNATFTVAILDDARFEGVETVRMVLSDPTGGATLGTRSTGTLTILDDESSNPGIVDQTFDPGPGVQGIVRSMAVSPNGSVLVAGDFYQVGGVERNGLARLNPDGSLDTGFQPILSMGDRVNSVVCSPAGKIVIGGSFTTVGLVSRGRVAQLREDGSVDPTFNPGSGANQEVLAVCVQPDHRVLIGGAFQSVQGVARAGLARLNADGSLDSTFVPPVPDGVVRTLSLQDDGAILVGGNFTAMSGVARTFVARLKPDGTLDPGFDPGLGNTVHDGTGIYSLALQSDGAVILGGDFTILFGRGRSALMRVSANGALDDSFAPNVPTGDKVWSVALQADGKVLAGGTFVRLANPACCELHSRNGIARFNPDGSVDTSFDPGTGASPQSVHALAIQRDLKVLMGGAFTDVDRQTRRGVARLIGDLPPRIQSVQLMPDQRVEVLVLAQPEQSYVLEVSNDTLNWGPLATNLSQTSLLNFIDRTSPDVERRFYRVRQLAR